jgi:hypothetical protein
MRCATKTFLTASDSLGTVTSIIKDQYAVRCHWNLWHRFVVCSLRISGRNGEQIRLSFLVHRVTRTVGRSAALHICGFQLYL